MVVGRVFIIGGHLLCWFSPDAEQVEVNPTMCISPNRENFSAFAHRGTFCSWLLSQNVIERCFGAKVML